MKKTEMEGTSNRRKPAEVIKSPGNAAGGKDNQTKAVVREKNDHHEGRFYLKIQLQLRVMEKM